MECGRESVGSEFLKQKACHFCLITVKVNRVVLA